MALDLCQERRQVLVIYRDDVWKDQVLLPQTLLLLPIQSHAITHKRHDHHIQGHLDVIPDGLRVLQETPAGYVKLAMCLFEGTCQHLEKVDVFGHVHGHEIGHA